MENLFLQAMDADKLLAINEIKANKEFAMKLINDLSQVFHTNHIIKDGTDYSLISMKVSPSYIYSQYFNANKNGITFSTKSLGSYKSEKPNWCLGELYEKYKDNGTTADSGFTDKKYGHGFVEFRIPFQRNDANLNNILKDIIYLMEFKGFRKRF
jgi:hypothetical protein